jgi:hypothetical protein
MKNFIAGFIILCFGNISNAQLVSNINDALKIPDSLGWQKEIRIYEFESITNYRSLFRLYQTEDKKWHIEYSKYYYSLNNNKEDKVVKTKVSAKSDFELLWLKILDTDIEHLTQWRNIEYKLKEKGEIKFEHGEYDIVWKSKKALDGKSYMVEFRNGDNFNSITYSNPKEYLNNYPNVDELNSLNELLKLIEAECSLSKL